MKRIVSTLIVFALTLTALVSSCASEPTNSPSAPAETLDFSDAALFGKSFDEVENELLKSGVEITTVDSHGQSEFVEQSTSFGLELNKTLDFDIKREILYGISYRYVWRYDEHSNEETADFYETVGEIRDSLAAQFGDAKTPDAPVEEKRTIADLVEQAQTQGFAGGADIAYLDIWVDENPVQAASDTIAELESADGEDCCIAVHMDVERLGDEAAVLQITYRISRDLF